MEEKEEKNPNQTTNVIGFVKEHKDHVMYTLLVLVFALFFVTFLALVDAEDRWTARIDQILDDQCVSRCFEIYEPEINYTIDKWGADKID